jgi:hypothetical protein
MFVCVKPVDDAHYCRTAVLRALSFLCSEPLARADIARQYVSVQQASPGTTNLAYASLQFMSLMSLPTLIYALHRKHHRTLRQLMPSPTTSRLPRCRDGALHQGVINQMVVLEGVLCQHSIPTIAHHLPRTPTHPHSEGVLSSRGIFGPLAPQTKPKIAK